MKKRISLFIIGLCVFNTLISAQEKSNFSNIKHYEPEVFIVSNINKNNLEYSVSVDETFVYDNEWNILSTIKKSEKINDCSLVETDEHYLLIGKDDYWINADDLCIKKSALLPEGVLINQIEKNIEWVPTWYKDVIKCNGYEFKEVVYKNAPYLKDKWIDDAECWWYEDSLFSYPCVFRFQNTYFSMTVDGWGVHNFIINNITNKEDNFFITCSAQGFNYKSYEGNINYLNTFPKINGQGEFTLRLEYKNKLIYLYNNETNELIVELMLVTKEWIEKLRTYFKTGNNTFLSEKSAVNASAPSTNVSVKKLMTTNCNLKLRAAEATSSNVLTVMAQGTKVKILELGIAETIDGISSNWVKVEVQKGAKDRDGMAIAPKTVGWCYGGYLE